MKNYAWILAFVLVVPFITLAQDTTRQRINQTTPIQKRDRIHQQDHYLYLDGKMYRVQNGVRTEMKEKMQLQNGVIHPDGSYQLQNSDKMQLRNGECLDPMGNRYASLQQFNRNKVMTQQQINRSQRMNNPPRMNNQGRMMNNRGNQ